ncbi:MAG: right-handed parallel beta-helix repeat-containing protein [Ruminococcaceae bacterium]|nr:right-handed parallel beta-helix repeat-containing protein [Oscillospiraceae bacterium]
MYNFYVAKNGCDCNPGTSEKPFATIEKATEAIRELKVKGLDQPVTVTVREGDYRDTKITLDERDSGTPECPITYLAEGRVLINGGITIDPADFGPLNDEEKSRLHGDAVEKVVKLDLKKYGLTKDDWGEMCAVGSHSIAKRYDDIVTGLMASELFVNSSRMDLARYPNEGFLYTEEPIFSGIDHDYDGNKLPHAEWAKLRNPIGDIRRIDKGTAEHTKMWKTLDNVWTFGYPQFGWADETSPVLEINAEERTMKTKVVSSMGLREDAPYYFYNVFEELDIPGEWYFDRDNGIVYLYPPKPIMECEIFMSIRSDTLVSITNASDITLRGFTITSTRGNGVVITGDRCMVDSCEIKNIAGHALRMEGVHCSIINNHVHHIGMSGVTLRGGEREELVSAENVIINNHVHHIGEIGKTYMGGLSLHGVGGLVAHNCIHDTAHVAASASGNYTVFEYNEIYNACLHCDDSGSFYVGGDLTNCGNTIRYNYFHDLHSEAKTQHIGIFGVYIDDNNGPYDIYGNVFHRCQCALLLHGGHRMRFENNLIIDACPRSQFSMRIHKFGYWKNLIKGEDENTGGGQWVWFNKSPWKTPIWREAFPYLGEIFEMDPETEGCCPHKDMINNNFIINHRKIDINFDFFHDGWGNRLMNNMQFSDRKFVGIPEGDELDLSAARFDEILPDFERIPFDEMGLLDEPYVRK